MTTAAIVRDLGALAREGLSVLLLAALLLVTGCGTNNYAPRAELAPPPPFLTNGQPSFGPPAPTEIAMLESIQNIAPAAGGEAYGPVARKCSTRSVYTSDEGHLGLGFGDTPKHDPDLSFSHLYSGRDSAGMTVRFTMALPAATQSGCR